MEPRIVTLTCKTDGCVAKDVAIDLETDAEQYLCGGCCQFITDVKEPGDAGTTPAE